MAKDAKPVQPVRFTTTKYSELRVVLDPSAKKEVAGAVITTGLKKSFKSGLPTSVQFMDGELTTSDPEIIKALKSHPSYGLDWIAEDQEGEVELPDEVLKKVNEKRELVQSVRSKCPTCGKDFKNDFALQGHMKTHDK
jgi:hypothetical protein